MSSFGAAGLNGMRDDIWALVHAERAAIIEDLERIDDAQWEQPSLCDGWTVHDVVAHMVDTNRTTRLSFAADMVRVRFDFDRQNARGIERARGASPEQTLERLREVASRTSTPPAPLDTRLVEEVVHGEDIRRPLGLTRAYPQEAVARSLAPSGAHHSVFRRREGTRRPHPADGNGRRTVGRRRSGGTRNRARAPAGGVRAAGGAR